MQTNKLSFQFILHNLVFGPRWQQIDLILYMGSLIGAANSSAVVVLALLE